MDGTHTLLARFIHWTFIPLYAYGILKQLDDLSQLEDRGLLLFETAFALVWPTCAVFLPSKALCTLLIPSMPCWPERSTGGCMQRWCFSPSLDW